MEVNEVARQSLDKFYQGYIQLLHDSHAPAVHHQGNQQQEHQLISGEVQRVGESSETNHTFPENKEGGTVQDNIDTLMSDLLQNNEVKIVRPIDRMIVLVYFVYVGSFIF